MIVYCKREIVLISSKHQHWREKLYRRRPITPQHFNGLIV